MTLVRSSFRALMGHFATGVTVVTTVEEGVYYGMTVNAFCSVSLDPCLVLISLHETSATRQAIRRSGLYAVNVLTARQQPLAERFARRDLAVDERFAGVPLETRLTGAPLFTEALAHLECRVVGAYPGGDHALLVGEVVGLEHHTQDDEAGEADRAGANPLLFFRSAYAALPADSASGGIAAPATTGARQHRSLRESVRARGRLRAPIGGIIRMRDATVQRVSDLLQRDHARELARSLARVTEKDASL